MRYREEDDEDEAVAIISPSLYFGSGCPGVGVPLSYEDDSSEHPADITLKIRRRENKRKNREFPFIVLF
jgi:hypothetical protein